MTLLRTNINSTFVLGCRGSNKNILIKPHVKESTTSGSWGFLVMRPSNYIEYKEGEKVGECVFIENTTPHIQRNGEKLRMAMFKCPLCGIEFAAVISNVKRLNTTTCGCNKKEKLLNAISSHKLSKHPLYRKWGSMVNRCYNEKDKSNYEHHGKLGIKVCDEWRYNFKAFYDYVITLPHCGDKGYSLDRIDSNGDYKPGNVRWADDHTQAANQRVRRDSKSGYTGITPIKNGWVSNITVNRKVYRLGSYKNIQSAINARNEFICSNNLTEYKIQEYESVS